MLEKAFKITNSTGLDAKMSSMIVTRSTKFISNITIQLDELKINLKSIMGVITMAAGYNTVLTVKAEGSDAEDAVNAIYNLFENKFEEE
mgnify:CR=1 FL=1